MAAKIREVWLSDPELQRAGWSLVAHCAKDDTSLDEAESLACLKRMEAAFNELKIGCGAP